MVGVVVVKDGNIVGMGVYLWVGEEYVEVYVF